MTTPEDSQPAGTDARFEDAPLSDKPLRLRAEGAEDLSVISALVQDAVARAADVMFMPRKRRVVLLLNRFRWEDAEPARRAGREFERVRSALQIDDVTGMQARGIGQPTRETVLSVLSVAFEPAADAGASADDAETDADPAAPCPPGAVILTCAGDMAFRIGVECLSVTLADLTRPWVAAAGQPEHDIGDGV